MNSRQIDILNIGLIAVSLLLAFIIPFELFLLAYALLGPLHYMTEINWLEKNKFHLPTKRHALVPLILAGLVVWPKLLLFDSFEKAIEKLGLVRLTEVMQEYNNAIIFLWLLSVIALFFKVKKQYVGPFVLIILIAAYLFNSMDLYNLIFGLFVPTLLHVYIFTILFMLYGALKSSSQYGLLAVIAMVVVPFIISAVNISPADFGISEYVRQIFIDGKFYSTNAKLCGLLGINSGTQYSFSSIIDIKFQIFIAFAYLYHYLNWFSKTSVIGWHKSLNRPRSLVIGIVWLCSCAIYYIDFSTGIVFTLGISILHVFLEFPLNIISIQGIYSSILGGAKSH